MFKKENTCFFVAGIAVALMGVYTFWFITTNKHLQGFFSQINADHAELLALEKYLTDKGILVVPAPVQVAPGK